MKTKFYRPKDDKFMGHYCQNGFNEPYFVEIDGNGKHRFVHTDRVGEWKKRDKDHICFIKRGDWLEVLELPEKPWKWD